MAICPECGFVVPNDKKFCSNCGFRIGADFGYVAENRDAADGLWGDAYENAIDRKPGQRPLAGRQTGRSKEGLLSKKRPGQRIGTGLPTAKPMLSTESNLSANPSLSVGVCLLSMVLAMLPLIGLIVGLRWAKASYRPSRHNLSVAMAVFNIAEILIGLIAFVMFKFVFRSI
jgi:hypothetical protein